MSKVSDFLVEIHTEELPPKALLKLAESFCEEIKKGINNAELTFTKAQFFATPRRLAVKVNELLAKQSDKNIERKGPAYQTAYNEKHEPTPACIGFARSCGVTPDQLISIENDQGKWVAYKQYVTGKTAEELLPEIVRQALSALPIPKRMRWGSNTTEFVRPVHSIILLYGSKVITTEILGCNAGNITQGHRFHCTKALKISAPDKYLEILANTGHVIADFFQRKNKIRDEAHALVQRTLGKNINVMIDENLLNEVAGLVEWPVAILGAFDKNFLNIPQEALISAMQEHQRYFPVIDAQNKLLPYFVTISNIESADSAQVVGGNERVLRARLSDAAFFYETDRRIKLETRLEKLKSMVFQAKLGTLYNKVERIGKLAEAISVEFKLDEALTSRAGVLCKADLTSELVGEFPELQGIAGFYYALNDNEDHAVATAIKQHYQPRFSGDELPSSALGACIAVADRMDTLVGIFSIGLIPTGDKDPFGLRRAALGILRILIEQKIDLDLQKFIQHALMLYNIQSADLENAIWSFILERLKYWYQEQGISGDIFAAVSALNVTRPYDMHNRIHAVVAFKKLPEAESLSIANKRVSNILAQYEKEIGLKQINENLFEHPAEHQLADKIDQYTKKIEATKNIDYQGTLENLAALRKPVDDFFEHVMVMVDDQAKRENRLLMLKKLRGLFLQVADIALLQ